MSAAVCGKRQLFEDVHSSSSSSKRLRFTPSRSHNLSSLFVLFPSMDPQIVEKIFDSCDESMDHAINHLSNLCLDPAANGATITTNDILPDGQTIQGQPSSAQNGEADVKNRSFHNADGKVNLPSDGIEWVEMLVLEMKNASNLDDARARASKILEAFEKVVMSKSEEKNEFLYKENSTLKDHFQRLLQENNILKRAVAIQHERQVEQEEKIKEIQQLRQLVSQYQEQVKTLELNNYALSLHLKRAEEGSSMPDRFNPDIF